MSPGSFHGDRGGLHLRRAVLVGPGERQRAAFGGDGEERDVGIGGDGRIKRGVEHFLAIIGADEVVDDVARDRCAGDADAIAGLHHVRDQRLDLDDVAFFGACRNVDESAGHQGFGSSTQAASVTMTSMSSDQNEPSDSSAIAVTFCESASRIRVEKLARPARGPSFTLITFGCGFFSLKMWIALTSSSAVIGLSTETVQGTELPFSTSGGRSSLTLPFLTGASPMTARTASFIISGVAAAGLIESRNSAPAPASAPAALRIWRREQSRSI